MEPEPPVKQGPPLTPNDDTLRGEIDLAAQAGPLVRKVFISHTGKDTAACTFAAAILKPALDAAGLTVFMDFSNLDLGCKWPEELVKAAANSTVVVVVLSKTYTQRYWCMLELDLALHSHSTAQQLQVQQQKEPNQQKQQQPLVIPVFYDEISDIVQPDDIICHWRNARQHAVPPERQQWVNPERWAANIRAMEESLQNVRRRVNEASKDEDYQLGRRVVEAAVKAMPMRLHVGRVLGAEKQEARLIAEVVVPDPDRLGLWLHGCGGLGKTTMARLLYNRLLTQFHQHHAYVELDEDANVSQQLSNILGQLGHTPLQQTGSAAEMLQKLTDYVQDRTVLLVVDNVWAAGQLDDLLPRAFGQGSRVIITSRSSKFPTSDWWQEVERHLLQYEVSALSPADALALFRFSAGLHPSFTMPSRELHDAEKEIVKVCGGLPLVLKLTGALLRCTQPNNPRPPNEWKVALETLQNGKNAVDTDDKLKGILSKSFGSLQPEQQHMFLDVATVLRGQPKDISVAVWCGWHGNGAEFLYEGLERCNLLHTDGKGLMQMHDVLTALGRGILLTPGSPAERLYYGSRVWMQGGKAKGIQQGCHVLAAQLDHTVTRADLLLPDWSQARILLMGAADLSASGKIMPQLPSTLLWLQGNGQVDFKRLPFTNLAALRILQLEDCTKLVVLDHALCQLTDLQELQLRQCSQLATLPTDFGNLTSLTNLEITHGDQLEALPESFGGLKALISLNLGGCFKALPESFGQLKALLSLQLQWCSQLVALPESFGMLKALTSLVLNYCSQLETIPESFGELKALESLRLSRCRKLPALPQSFGQLTTLTTVHLSYCLKLAALPESFGQLKALTFLHSSRCRKLAALPESFRQLRALTTLHLGYCSRLVALPESFGGLESLRSLDLSYCSQLKTLPESLGELEALTSLILCYCSKLAALPERFGELKALVSLDLRNCSRLAALPESFGLLKALTSLVVGGCSQLAALPESFGELSALTSLDLGGCSQLASLPKSIGQLTALQELDLFGCVQLASLPDSFTQLSALRELNIIDSELAKSLDTRNQLAAMPHLEVEGGAWH